MKYTILLFLLLNFSSFGQSKIIKNLSYGKSEKQVLDLYIPDGNTKNLPVLILLHGGAWSMGGLEYTSKHAQDLCEKNLIVANIDYRYVTDNISAKDLLDDIHLGIALVSNLSSKYGYPDKGFHIAGISAGAHLALLYGYSKKNMKSITALCAPSRLDTPETFAVVKRNGLLEILEKLAGAKVNNSESQQAFTKISPFNLISNTATLLIHGDADNVVDVSQSQDLYNELQKSSVDSKLIIRKGYGHDVGMNVAEIETKNINQITDWIKTHN